MPRTVDVLQRVKCFVLAALRRFRRITRPGHPPGRWGRSFHLSPPNNGTACLEWMKDWAEEDNKMVLLVIDFDPGTSSLAFSKTSAALHTSRGFGVLSLLFSAALVLRLHSSIA